MAGTDSFLGVRNFWGFLTAGTDSYFGVRSFLVVLEVVLRWSKKPNRLVFCNILFSSKKFRPTKRPRVDAAERL